MSAAYEDPRFEGDYLQDLRNFILFNALEHPQTRTGDFGTRIADILLEPLRPKLLAGLAFSPEQKRYAFYLMTETPEALDYNNHDIAQLSLHDDEVAEGHITLKDDGRVHYDEMYEDCNSTFSDFIDDRRAWFLLQKLKVVFPQDETAE